MRLRADLHINGRTRKLVLAASPTETLDHLALKLAACAIFSEEEPVVEPGLKHPALAGQSMRPDLLAVDITGAASLWVECGNTTTNKMEKVVRKFPEARVAVLKKDEAEARRFREEIERALSRPARVETLAWREGGFREWLSSLGERNEIIGEVEGLSMNLVVNERVYLADLARF